MKYIIIISLIILLSCKHKEEPSPNSKADSLAQGIENIIQSRDSILNMIDDMTISYNRISPELQICNTLLENISPELKLYADSIYKPVISGNFVLSEDTFVIFYVRNDSLIEMGKPNEGEYELMINSKPYPKH